jgi:hypothetical protein
MPKEQHWMDKTFQPRPICLHVRSKGHPLVRVYVEPRIIGSKRPPYRPKVELDVRHPNPGFMWALCSECGKFFQFDLSKDLVVK